MPSASEIRSSVSTVGILPSPSTKLTVCRLSPARAERRFSESFCRNRSSLSRRAISEQIRVRNISSATHNHYKKQRLTKDATRVAYSCMFIRSEEHTSELQSLRHLVCRLLLEKSDKRPSRRRSADRPDAPYPDAESRADLVAEACAVRRWKPPWAASWCSSKAARDNAGGGAGCRDARRRWQPGARTRAACRVETRAPECALWPARSASRAPRRPRPAVRCRRACRAAGNAAADRLSPRPFRWPCSERSAA